MNGTDTTHERALASGELDDLLGVEAGLSDWEIEFLDTMAMRRESTGVQFTFREMMNLHEIWDRMCG